jgi:KDO2-lipid IV(A) lauroyltransferase
MVQQGPHPDLLAAVFENLALTAQEFLLGSWRHGEGNVLRVAESCRQIHRRLLDHQGGIVFTSAHLGNWEILGARAGSAGLPVNSVFKPLGNPWLDRWLAGQRRRFGQGTISKAQSPLATAMRCLREGKNVAFLVDQRPRRSGVVVRFLGIPTTTTPAPALLSLRSGAPVVPVCAIRTPDQESLLMLLGEPIYPNRQAPDRRREILRITQEFTRQLEEWIRLYPDQWLWLHRRWLRSEYAPAGEGRRPPLTRSFSSC